MPWRSITEAPEMECPVSVLGLGLLGARLCIDTNDWKRPLVMHPKEASREKAPMGASLHAWGHLSGSVCHASVYHCHTVEEKTS